MLRIAMDAMFLDFLLTQKNAKHRKYSLRFLLCLTANPLANSRTPLDLTLTPADRGVEDK